LGWVHAVNAARRRKLVCLSFSDLLVGGIRKEKADAPYRQRSLGLCSSILAADNEYMRWIPLKEEEILVVEEEKERVSWIQTRLEKPMSHRDKDRWAFVLPCLQRMNTCGEYRSKKKISTRESNY
jgi:hypothetical protein